MDIVTTTIIIVVVSVAIVAPWATISAFESSRLIGWTVTLVAMMAHVATWAIMAHSKEAAFFCAAPWAVYEIVLSFIPMGIGEAEYQKEQTAEATDKG
mgnify:FL=1